MNFYTCSLFPMGRFNFIPFRLDDPIQVFRKLAADRQDACASIQKQAKRQARDAQRCNLFRLVSSGDQPRSVKRAPPNGEFSGIHRIRCV